MRANAFGRNSLQLLNLKMRMRSRSRLDSSHSQRPLV
jgi:hypothetical protein